MAGSPTEQADQAIAAGHQQEDRGSHEAALSSYRRAAQIAPQYPRAHLNIGNALRNLHRYEEAASAFRLALALDPDYAHAYFNLGTLLAETGKRAEATSALATALRLQPDEVMAAKVVDAESYMLFSSAFREQLDPGGAAREHMRVGSLISRLAGPPCTHWSNGREPDRKLRVAYVSGDFGDHPVALFLRPVLREHDRALFEIHCYSNNPDERPVPASISSNAHAVRNVSRLSDAELVDLVRADSIDVLVDLSGHTENNRLRAFARHPAPVQVTWLGYLNTTGLQQMDYRICDWHTDPPGETEHLHTEQLYRLPFTQWCYEPWPAAPNPGQRSVPEASRVVFGSANQHLKVSDRCLDLWSQILSRVPQARLVVLDMRDERVAEATSRRLLERGIAKDRITLRGRLPIEAYYQSLAEFDIALDTYPHNGATTTFDTLWMGAPIVGLRGNRGISRCTYSILKCLRLTELIATSEAAYIELNVQLAENQEWRSALSSGLRERLSSSALMDAKRFVTDLEAAYRRMWRTWCDRHTEDLDA
jgi:protein O-GlcNAc transferase